MFGMGMGELLLILVVALLVVGPDKLPGAAKAIGKGIRDLRRHTIDLQDTIEKDEHLGEAVRELKSALHGDPRPFARPAPRPAAPAAGGPAAPDGLDPPRVVPASTAVAKGELAAEPGQPAQGEPAPAPAPTVTGAATDDPRHG